MKTRLAPKRAIDLVNDSYYKTEHLMQLLDCCQSTVSVITREPGFPPPLRNAKSHKRWPADQVRAWLDASGEDYRAAGLGRQPQRRVTRNTPRPTAPSIVPGAPRPLTIVVKGGAS